MAAKLEPVVKQEEKNNEPNNEQKQEPAAYVVKDDEKYAAFRRLAGKRLQKALDMIDLIGNCANRSQYEYSPEQVEKVRLALQTQVDFTMNKFAPAAKATSRVFEL